MKLTTMQKRYVWLAGSYALLHQGRGRRTAQFMYGVINGDEAVAFGYSYPPIFLCGRGVMKAGQARNTFHLTDAGERLFLELQLSGYQFDGHKVRVMSDIE